MNKDKNILESNNVTINIGSACLGNPGPGGFAAILEYKTAIKEISCGYEKTIDIRMKIMAVIRSLETLKRPCKVIVCTDSEPLVKAMKRESVSIANRHDLKNNKIREANIDLWDKLSRLCKKHDVKFELITKNNNSERITRCNELAMQALNNIQLSEDIGYYQNKLLIKKDTQIESANGKPLDAIVCPICGGLGYLMVKAHPHSNQATVKIMCSQCLGKKYLKKSEGNNE